MEQDRLDYAIVYVLSDIATTQLNKQHHNIILQTNQLVAKLILASINQSINKSISQYINQ